MDRSSLLIGIILIAAGFGLMVWNGQQQEEYQRQLRQFEQANEPAPGPETAAPKAGNPLEAPLEQSAAPSSGASEASALEQITAAPAPKEPTGPSIEAALAAGTEVVLQNDWISVTLTSAGAAIEEVRFLRTRAGREDNFVFNEHGRIPALALFTGPPDSSSAAFFRDFDVVSAGPTEAVFRIQLQNGLELERTYRLNPADGEGDPYLITHSTTLKNQTGFELPGSLDFFFSLGAAGPLETDRGGEYTNFGFFSLGEDTFINASKFRPSSGVLGIGSRTGTDAMKGSVPVDWAAVKNQYFTAVLTPEEPGTGYWAEALSVDGEPYGSNKPLNAIAGFLSVDVPPIVSGGAFTARAEYFVGPKEYRRLNDLGKGQDAVMQFGFFGFFSRLLLLFMYAIHAVVPSWGWSIVIMTVIIKLLFWPLTAKAAQSQKRMQKIQGPLKEIAEKYKDNPEKKNKETLKLFREAKVNPAAGCLPILIQIPIFFGLFLMLRTASELRYAEFLWISDLSQPDTIFSIAGFPVNLMPLLMGVSMYFQMRMTPMMTGGDPVQQKIFRFLPFVFLIFLYNFSSGLVVYWTVQNLLTILQQWITNRRKEPELEVLPPTSTKGKKAKPAKKV